MIKTSKIILFATLFSLVLSLNCLNNNRTTIPVQAYDDVSNIWGTELNEIKNRNYSFVKNATFTGKYYKAGIMGHHRVVKFLI